MNISIVIINRNSEIFASKLMKTLIHSCENIDECKEIIIVDNASTDNSLKIFEEYSKSIMRPQIKIIKLNRNTGFCYAVNVGVALAKSELVAILNPDLYVDADWLSPIIEDFKNISRLGVVQPLIYWYQYPEKIQSTGLYADIIGNYKGNIFGSKVILAPFGAAYVVRRKAFIEIGGLDPIYFMYGDELDLGLRMWLAGWIIMLEPRSKVYHFMGGVTSRSEYMRYLKYFLMRRNQLITLMKSLSLKNLIIVIPLLTLINIFRGIRLIESLRAILMAYYKISHVIRHIVIQRVQYSKIKVLNEDRLRRWGLIRPLTKG